MNRATTPPGRLVRAKPPTRRPRSVVVIGGGTGSFNVLRGLRAHEHLAISAIVSMMDSGGDSGRLRDEFGVLPPGDARRCLVALADEAEILRDLFSYRFTESPMSGRNFGNLFVLALTRMLGSEQAAIEALSRIMKVRGKVLGVTWDSAHLHAALTDGTHVAGEAAIDTRADCASAIDRVWLEPAANVNADAAGEIVTADYLVLAPGDLYTSTVPNLLVTGMPEALQAARAPLIHVMNLMTKPGETDGYTASDHVTAVIRYGGRVPDAVVVDDSDVPTALLDEYGKQNSSRVTVDEAAIRALGVAHVEHANLMSSFSFVRHDPRRCAQTLLRVFEHLDTRAAAGELS